MKIRPVGAELFHADGRTDRHDEANSCFFAILRTRLKTSLLVLRREIIALYSEICPKHTNDLCGKKWAF
jgi:hypothetical protein